MRSTELGKPNKRADSKTFQIYLDKADICEAIKRYVMQVRAEDIADDQLTITLVRDYSARVDLVTGDWTSNDDPDNYGIQFTHGLEVSAGNPNNWYRRAVAEDKKKYT